VAPTATAGQVAVTDNGGTKTVSGVGSLIQITGTNAGDTITFTGNTGFNGNVLINGSNGDDIITVNAAAANVTNGNVTVLSGLGNDTTNLAGRIGGTLTSSNTSGADIVNITGAATVGGDASLSGVSTLNQTAALTTGGSLTVSGLVNTSTPLTVNSLADLTVGRNLQVTGGSGTNMINVVGNLSVNGSATINFGLGTGTNSEILNPAGGTGIGGNLQITGGAADDTTVLAPTVIVGSSTTLNLGEGTNLSTIDGLFAGPVSVNGGNTVNTTTIGAGAGTALFGSLTISYGNGTNTTTVNVAPGGLLTYRGGNNVDTVNLTPTTPSTFNVNMAFGSGTNTLTLNANVTLTGRVTSQNQAGDTFNQGGATLAPNLFFQF